ncbi:MAG TPA: LON peptidase substrate-binding domain-containing protein, partial [Anaerolineaceae bacterium]|nr:LON peptidase substrate-binding domain-containing protein [Anaerolineaceae bacterium]
MNRDPFGNKEVPRHDGQSSNHPAFFETPTDLELHDPNVDPSDLLSKEEQQQIQIPENLPVLRLRGMVVYPQTAVPLTIGQPRSIRLVDDVVAGDRLVGLFTAIDAEQETPGPDDLYPIGTLAMIHRLFRAPDGTIRLLVQGLARIRIDQFTQTEPYLAAKVNLAPEQVEVTFETEALARSVRNQFQQIAELMPSMPRELVATIAGIEDPLVTAYTIANFQRISVSEA